MIANIFLPLLEWLASQTSAEAKDAPKFDFDTRGKPNDDAPTRFFIDSEIRLDVVQRICCALGGSTSPSLSVSELASQPHQYRGKATEGALGSLPGGGKAGYVYTRHGGFIDLGHVRDYIDYTRFFAARYLGAPLTGRGEANELSKLFSEKGDIHLIVAPRAKKPSAIQAVIVGAKLAYERHLA